ncbi:MAG: TolC family protein [Polyangiaceae bacterium]
MTFRLLGGVSALVIASWAGASAAQDASHRSTVVQRRTEATPLRVSLAYALKRAAKSSPELGPSRAAQRSAQRSREASRQWLSSNPRLELAAGPRLGADDGFDASIGLWQDIPLAGVGESRQRYADARAVAARFMLRSAELEAALSAGLAWVDARVARELLRIRQESVNSAKQLLEVTQTRFATGAATAGDHALARSIHGAAKAGVLDAEGRRFSADIELAYAVGANAERALEVIGKLDVDGKEFSEAEAFARLASSPQLKQLAAEAKAARAAATQSHAEGSPQLSLGPQVTREGTGDWVVLGRVSLPLPLIEPRRLESAEHRRTANVALAEYQRVQRGLRREVHLLLHERKHARRTRDALARDAIEPARVALSEALLKYSSGKSTIQEVNVARLNLLDAKERWLLAAADARATELKLLAITGRLPGAQFGLPQYARAEAK